VVSSFIGCARATGSWLTGMLEPLAPCGMSEALAPREVAFVNGKCRFLTTGELLSLVVFSASLGWLLLSVP
jgi:hypothetical protein